jgi:hypothetical protein
MEMTLGYFRRTMPHVMFQDFVILGKRETIFQSYHSLHKAQILMSKKMSG